ncbi:unnamed protein product [Bursaphelenchus okinawaensis]|uniref:Protein ABHD13 n=1 Tax=Bursaphelenchus okinawaensis TaxID=465554 RepID=A0A811LA55_9BILA|nr:unnamed protein product [Bursaphelenchus okinawaensis]CAG9120435.1 unnamed protein product [Bursaphelenchus okinawaensis]
MNDKSQQNNKSEVQSTQHPALSEYNQYQSQATQQSVSLHIPVNDTQGDDDDSSTSDDTNTTQTSGANSMRLVSKRKEQSTLYKLDVTQDDELSKAPLIPKKKQKIESKYKLLPRILLEPDNTKIVSDRSKKNHTKRCRAFNRFKSHPDFIFKTDKKKEQKDQKFLKFVEDCKFKKPPMICVCEEKRCQCWGDVTYVLKKVLRSIWRLIYMFLCPPWPTSTLLKLAFWPPPREYFFFYNSDRNKSGSQAAQTAEVKIRRGSRKAVEFNHNVWRFGFEHECLPEVLNIKGFVVPTKSNTFVGGIIIRSPHHTPRYTLLFSHPNGSDISDHLTGVPKLHEIADYLNCDIVAYDYSGYGISSGSPSESNAFCDIDAVYNYIIKEEKVPEENIILWGTSIGTAVTINQAQKLSNIAGVMLFSPPTSMIRTLYWKRCCCCQTNQPCKSPDWRCRIDKFDSLGKVVNIKVPLLICHGTEDELVPIEHGQALFEASKSKNMPLWVIGASHNNLENNQIVWLRVRDFLYKETHPPLPKTGILFNSSEFQKVKKKKKRKKEKRSKNKRSSSPKQRSKKSRK